MKRASPKSRRYLAILAPLLSLAGCGGPSAGAIETTIERSWGTNPEAMAVATGLAAPEDGTGLARGAQSSVRKAIGAVRGYAGDRVANIAQDALGSTASIADDFRGTSDVKGGFGRALARDWDVINLEILDKRSSGEDYVVRVRYDVYATIAGERRRIGKDLTQTVRLVYQDGSWIVAQ